MSTFQPAQQPQRTGNDWAPPRTPVVEKQRGGPPCLLYGAIGCVVVIGLLIVAAVVAYFGIKAMLADLIKEYTDTQPVTIPVVEMADTDLQALTARVAVFKSAIEHGDATAPLVLTEQEINALIQYDPDWKDLKGKIYVSIKDNLLEGQVSFPLDALETEATRGRYLNGSAKFNVFLRNSMLFVHLEYAEVRGKALPEEFLTAFRAQNLAENMQQDPEFVKLMRKLDTIEVKDNTLLITPKLVSAGETLVEAPDSAGAVEAEPSQSESGTSTDSQDASSADPTPAEPADAPGAAEPAGAQQ